MKEVWIITMVNEPNMRAVSSSDTAYRILRDYTRNTITESWIHEALIQLETNYIKNADNFGLEDIGHAERIEVED